MTSANDESLIARVGPTAQDRAAGAAFQAVANMHHHSEIARHKQG
jgi:hypothetical protein